MSVPFRERNPVIIGAVSLAVIAPLILGAFNAQDLPLIGGGDTYYAASPRPAGLKANDEVRIAGVRVGKVESVALDGDHVKVTFRVEDRLADFGAQTRGRDQDQDAARRDVPLPRAGRLGPARAGQRDPRRPHQLAVRRRATRSRAWPRPRSRSTPTSSPSRSPRWPT